jgi:hypothetical protein
VEWEHTIETFSLLETVVSVWRSDGSLFNMSTVGSAGPCEVEVEGEAAMGARVSLQSKVNQAISPPGEQRLLFEEEQDLLTWILMIIALTVLLLLYILATTFCLRRLCHKSGRLDPSKQRGSNADPEPGTPGVYSPGRFGGEQQRLLGNGHKPTGVNGSDAGSDNTDQSLLVSGFHHILMAN